MIQFRTLFLTLSLALALFATACGSKASDKLIGKWGVDESALGDMPEMKAMPEDQRKMALEAAKGMMGSMTFEFTADKMLIDMMGQKKEGTYVVKSQDGDKMVIEGTMDGKTETMNAEFKGDTLVMANGKQNLPLKRK